MTGPVEVSAVIDSSLIRRCTAENLRLPSIEMRIKVYNRDFTVGSVNRAQDRENNSMIAAKSDNTWMMLSVLRDCFQSFAGDRIVSKRREGGTV